MKIVYVTPRIVHIYPHVSADTADDALSFEPYLMVSNTEVTHTTELFDGVFQITRAEELAQSLKLAANIARSQILAAKIAKLQEGR